jgi:chemotaxis protein methyltransferase CheR
VVTKAKRGSDLDEQLFFVVDITDQRAAERKRADLIDQHELMLQEMRHRMSNGLQIIASILRIKTHLAKSAEVRTHLDDVHRRVLSMAALEDQLDPSKGIDPSSVRPYLVAVCQRLATTLIDPSTGVELRVVSADVRMDPERIVGIGLVVTELVINALKHGFGKSQERGVIQVTLAENGPSWTLSVADSGVGCRHEAFHSASGLGTRIVRTLARRLTAQLEISPNLPHGLRVALTWPRLLHPAD